jgi:hypothetical protein
MTTETGKENKKISTSQLAKRHGMESRELFELLSGAKWIVRNHADTEVIKGKQPPKWLLTAKGEFEGGVYFSSDKFGTYIVWPASVVKHPMIQELQEKPLTATQIGKAHQLHGRLVNQILAEIGWIEQHIDGWELTNAGLAVGGQARENEKTGVHYALWPQQAVADSRLQRALSACDLNQLRTNNVVTALDGHQHDCPERVFIDNWLYLNGLAHACARPLDNDAEFASDFYLPQGRIFIEYWGAEDGAERLLGKLKKLDIYHEHQDHLVEIEPQHLPELDDYLAKQLLKFGIKVYG